MDFSPLSAGRYSEGGGGGGGSSSTSSTGAGTTDGVSSSIGNGGRRKRIPAAFSRKLRSLCDMLSIGHNK